MEVDEYDIETVPFTNSKEDDIIFMEELNNEPYGFCDQTTENNIYHNGCLLTSAESENMPTNIKCKTQKKENFNKNAPRLYCKQLDSLSRGEKSSEFTKRKQKLFDYDENKIKEFHIWLDKNVHEKLLNLKAYKNIWTVKEEDIDREFKNVFKELSNLFFTKFAVRYVANSHMTNFEQRKRFLRLIPRFLLGIKNPEKFNSLV